MGVEGNNNQNNNYNKDQDAPGGIYVQSPYDNNQPQQNAYDQGQVHYQNPHPIQPHNNNNQGVVNNQIITVISAEMFRTVPVITVCAICKVSAPTIVKTSLNCANYMYYCWFGVFYWLCFQALRNKDMTCMDATHYCSACGTMLASYSAC